MKQKRIAVNARFLQKGKLEGIGWFTYESLKRITQNHPEYQFYFIFDRPYDPEFIFAGNVTPVVAGIPARHPILWWLWFEVTIPRVLKKINADVFISPDGFTSLRTKCPSLSVIHDINFEHHPEYLPFLKRLYFTYYSPKFAAKAARIATVSEYSKSDIHTQYSVPLNKIDLCYNGSNAQYVPLSKGEKQKSRTKYADGYPYFGFIGALSPRKNIPGLLKAFDIFKKNSQSDHKLLIVGGAMHKTGNTKTTYAAMRYSEDVHFLGRLEVADLRAVLGAAEALVYLPFFEGFGIPLVEAMYAEIPIISSNRTSMPEVAGEAALLADPDNPDEAAKAMNRIVEDASLRYTLLEKGREQRKKFSWDKTAEALWNSILKLPGIC